MKRCFLFGHREECGALFEQISCIAKKLIEENGVEEFVVGNRGGFDHIAAVAVAAVRDSHPKIRLVLLQAYYQPKNDSLPSLFDSCWFPSDMENIPKKLAIPRANRYAVEQAHFVIAYVWHTASNSQKLLEYAQRREQKGFLQIIRLSRS